MINNNSDKSPIDSSYRKIDNTSKNKNNSSNADGLGTNCNTSPRLTEKLLNLNCYDSTFDKTIQDGNLPEDVKDFTPQERAAYLAGCRHERLRIERESDPYQRPDRYKPELDEMITTRIDTCTFTINMGSNERRLHKLKAYCKRSFGMIFEPIGDGTRYYNHVEKDFKYACLIEYSKESDVAGTKNNKGKASVTFQGKWAEAFSVRQIMEFLEFLHDDLEAKCTRIDPRVRDYSIFLTPGQLHRWMMNEKKVTGKIPITGVKIDPEYIGDLSENETLYIGGRKSDRRLSMYDERYKHNSNSIAYELRNRRGYADRFFRDIVAKYKSNANVIAEQVKSFLETKTDWINQQIYNKQVECNAYHEPFDKDRRELTERLINGEADIVVSQILHGLIAGAVLSAFTITEGRTAKDVHLSRLNEASFWTEFKSKVQDLEHWRPSIPKQVTPIEGKKRWIKSATPNTITMIGAAQKGIKPKQLLDMIRTNPTETMAILLDGFNDFYRENFREHLMQEKFFRSDSAKLLNIA